MWSREWVCPKIAGCFWVISTVSTESELKGYVLVVRCRVTTLPHLAACTQTHHVSLWVSGLGLAESSALGISQGRGPGVIGGPEGVKSTSRLVCLLAGLSSSWAADRKPVLFCQLFAGGGPQLRIGWAFPCGHLLHQSWRGRGGMPTTSCSDH